METQLGEYLRVHGMTHEEFADKANVPAPQVSLWSRGIRRPGISNAMKIAEATGGLITIEYWSTVVTPPRPTKRRKRNGSRKVA